MTDQFNSPINRHIYNYFLIFFSVIPISIVAGPSVSLINILIIDISFVILIIIKKDFYFLSNKNFRYLVILYLYLILNTFISLDYSMSLSRNLGFVRMIILFLAINYFFNIKYFFKKVFLFWSFFLCVLVFDIFYEFYIGQNIFGFKGDYGNRIVSFFKDEPIAGSFVSAFFLLIGGFYLNEYKKHKFWIIFFIIIVLISILFTGERSSFLKSLAGFIIFLLFFKEYTSKSKILFALAIIISLLSIITHSDFLKHRFIKQFKVIIISVEDNHYIRLQKSGLEVFYENKLFGVGNKNYRVDTCKNPSLEKQKFYVKYCSTHPHQVYLEFLSEHGLIGFILLMFIFYKIIFSKIKATLNSKNYIGLGALCYLVFTFTPIIPSGAFFNDFSLTLFFINLSIFCASNSNLNHSSRPV